MRSLRLSTIVLFWLGVCFTEPAAAQDRARPGTRVFGETVAAAPGGPSGRGGRAVRSRRARADARALLAAASAGSSIELNLFEDRPLPIRGTRLRRSANRVELVGEIAGERTSQVVLFIRENRITGSVRTADGEFYQIRSAASGEHTIEQIQVDRSIISDDVLVPPPTLVPPEEAPKMEGERAAALEVLAATAPSTLDLMVLYTPEARAAAGGEAAIQDEIRLAVAEANQGFVNSGIDIVLRLVHAAEAAPSSGQAASNAYLNLITYDASLRELRNAYGADIVNVWVNGPGSRGGTVGLSWLMTRPSVNFGSAAYGIVEMNFATGPYYAFGHEIGHLLGAAHDRANSDGPGAFPFAYGYQQRSGTSAERFVTIMAYHDGCIGCQGINHYANPEVSFAGHPTGISANEPEAADVRLAFNSTRTFAEQWRATVVTDTGAVAGPEPPSVISLSPSAGTGTSAVFTATVSDPNGSGEIDFVALLIREPDRAGCLITVSAASGSIWLRNEGDTGWLGPVAAAQQGELNNSLCSIRAADSAVTAAGNTVAVRASVAFSAGFSGTREVLVRADDRTGLSSGWQKLGEWTVPAEVPAPAAPQVLSVTPNAASGGGAVFSIAVSDANGAGEVSPVLIVIGSELLPYNACYVHFVPATTTAYLMNDSGTQWLGPVQAGSGSASNASCTLYGSGLSAAPNGNQLILQLPIGFAGSRTGSRGIWVAAGDAGSLWSPWTRVGTFTVE